MSTRGGFVKIPKKGAITTIVYKHIRSTMIVPHAAHVGCIASMEKIASLAASPYIFLIARTHRAPSTLRHRHRTILSTPANLTRRWSAIPQGRPFKILGLQQVAIGGPDKEVLAQLWTEILGIPKIGSYKSEKENVCEDILKLGQGVSAVEIDLMEPIDPEKAPRVHVPALNHIGLWVHPLTECVEWLTRQGMRFTPGGIRKGAAGHDVAFIHPKGDKSNPLCGEGVLIELVQAPPDVIADADKH